MQWITLGKMKIRVKMMKHKMTAQNVVKDISYHLVLLEVHDVINNDFMTLWRYVYELLGPIYLSLLQGQKIGSSYKE